MYFQHARFAITLFAATLLLTACSMAAAPEPEVVITPIAAVSPTTENAPAIASQETPTETPTETSAPETELPALGETLTYELPEVGIALDYPASWQVIDVAPDTRAQSMFYAITFNAEAATEGSQRTAPEDLTKFDLVIENSEDATLESALQARKDAFANDPTSGNIVSEQEIILPSGIPAVRLEIEGRFSPALDFLFVVDGRTIILSGLGDFPLIEAIAQTVRPLE